MTYKILMDMFMHYCIRFSDICNKKVRKKDTAKRFYLMVVGNYKGLENRLFRTHDLFVLDV